jgi:hypothetical protein
MGGGGVTPDGDERFVFINPFDREALIDISMPTESDLIAPASFQELRLPAGRQTTVKVEGVALGTKHGAVFKSTNGVPFVVERASTIGIGPTKSSDLVMAADSLSGHWTVFSGSGLAGFNSVSITNFSSEPVEITVTATTDSTKSPGMAGHAISIAAGRMASIDLSGLLPSGLGIVHVDADGGGIAVESRTYTADPSFRDFSDAVGRPG